MKTIRRSPELEARIANAMEEFHETGPLLLVELADEVTRLREQVVRLKQHVATPAPSRAQTLVDALRPTRVQNQNVAQKLNSSPRT